MMAYAGSLPNLPRPPRDTLVIATLSTLDDTTGPSVDALARYAGEFFGLPVRVISMDTAMAAARRREHDGARQLNAADVLDVLQTRLPDDAYCVIALTTEDLYPTEDFNFVFGMARLKARVGVFSFARYASPDRTQAVRRAFKVMTHEVGHMFGITHCTHFSCNMNGSNSRDEMDREPMHLCPVCLRKLHMAVGFDPEGRYRALRTTYAAHGMTAEAAWVDGRLATIDGGP